MNITQEEATHLALISQDLIIKLDLDKKLILKSEMKQLLKIDKITDSELLWFTIGTHLGIADTVARIEQSVAERSTKTREAASGGTEAEY